MKEKFKHCWSSWWSQESTPTTKSNKPAETPSLPSRLYNTQKMDLGKDIIEEVVFEVKKTNFLESNI